MARPSGPGQDLQRTCNVWRGASAFGLRVAWLRPEGQAEPPRLAAPKPVVTTWEQLPALFLR